MECNVGWWLELAPGDVIEEMRFGDLLMIRSIYGDHITAKHVKYKNSHYTIDYYILSKYYKLAPEGTKEYIRILYEV